MFAVLAAALALSACATTTQSPDNSALNGGAVPSGGGRDLTPPEKKVIIEAVAPSLRDAAAAKYRWAKFPTSPSEGSVNYCATVDAKSPYEAYSGHQAYIVEAKVVGGKVTAATLGLITGGKDIGLVVKMCAKYGLNPNSAS